MIRLALVDDHQVLTDALSIVFRAEPDIELLGSAGTCAAALTLLAETCPDVLLLDVDLPDGDGLDTIPELRQLCPEMHILVLTSYKDERTLQRAIDRGVSGFLPKSHTAPEVLAAVREAAAGQIVMPSSLLLALIQRAQRTQQKASRPDWEPLTPREHEVLSCLSQGMNEPEIAQALTIAPLTVRTHIRNLMGKLGVRSRLEAVSFALRNRIIEPPV